MNPIKKALESKKKGKHPLLKHYSRPALKDPKAEYAKRMYERQSYKEGLAMKKK